MSSEFCVKPETTSLINDVQTNWYIFYTYPRAEKIVRCELEKKGYEVFLPMRKEFKIWKNRQKKFIDNVLFTGYIFVNTHVHEIYNVLKTPKIVTYIGCGGKPSFLRPKEIQCIRMMINLDPNFMVESTFCEGQKVRIVSGPLIGHEGVLIEKKGKSKFGIQLKEINHSVFIDISVSALEKL